jgi:hypothetical protein
MNVLRSLLDELDPKLSELFLLGTRYQIQLDRAKLGDEATP